RLDLLRRVRCQVRFLAGVRYRRAAAVCGALPGAMDFQRTGKSVIPFAFWFLSMGGGVMTLVYGIVKREPVIIMGQGLSTIIYLRNIMLILKERKQPRAGDVPSA